MRAETQDEQLQDWQPERMAESESFRSPLLRQRGRTGLAQRDLAARADHQYPPSMLTLARSASDRKRP
jgi:hypothetical protein